MTLLVRDEADIVGTNIAYHLAQGVDHVLATDNLSQDGTTEILRAHERTGRLSYRREPREVHDQARWVTRMAREAHRRFPGAIVFHVDADEFWWPCAGTLTDRLRDAFPGRAGVRRVERFNYVGPNRSQTLDDVFDRLRYRQTHSRNVLGKPLPGKVCHTSCSVLEIDHGNHRAFHSGEEVAMPLLEEVEVLHFPNRTVAQFVAKIRRGMRAVKQNHSLPDGCCNTWRAVDRSLDAGTFSADFPDQILSPADVEALVTCGELETCDKLAIYLRAHGLIGSAPHGHGQARHGAASEAVPFVGSASELWRGDGGADGSRALAAAPKHLA